MISWKGTPQRRVPDLDLEKVDSDGPSGHAFVFWLIVLVWPLWDLAHGRAHPVWLAAAALPVFAILHVAVIRTSFDGRVPIRVPIVLLVAEAAVASAASLAFQSHWYTMFPLLGLAAGVLAGHMPRNGRGPELPMLLGIGGVSTLSVLVGWAGSEDGGAIVANWYGTATAGVVTAIILRLFTVIGMLRDAREELAEAAVARERLRFSRDLHDLLGHTLSLMVVKAQAVRRIAERDPAVAAEQAADIETVGRRALDEVRQAVSGYRGRGLAGELDAARTALSAAGVDVTVQRTGPPPPPDADALLGWALREGVTNVIRHSRAAHCKITIHTDKKRATLTVQDDGTGTAAGPGKGEVAGKADGAGKGGRARKEAGADEGAGARRSSGAGKGGGTGKSDGVDKSGLTRKDAGADEGAGTGKSSGAGKGGGTEKSGGRGKGDGVGEGGRAREDAGADEGGGVGEDDLVGDGGGLSRIGGFGLRGLSERVAAVEGGVEAGPVSGGGFLLAVEVPLRAGAGAGGQ